MQNMHYQFNSQKESAEEHLNAIAEIVDDVRTALAEDPPGLDSIAVGDAHDDLDSVQDGITHLANLLGVTVEW